MGSWQAGLVLHLQRKPQELNSVKKNLMLGDILCANGT